MKKIVDFITTAGLIFVVCLVGLWDAGHITGLNALVGIICTVPVIISGGFVCSLISSVQETHRRQYKRI